MPYLMKKGLLYDLEDSFDILMDYHVIFIGEEHGSPVSRNAERTILKGLAERDSKLILALEMFERDVQDILDAYLKGKISEKTFLKRSRPWPNYLEDYRPLIEFAKKKRMLVIAANIPRRAAAEVSVANKISPDIMGEDKIYLPKTIYLKSKEYYNRFASSMDEMPHSTPMKGMDVDGLYKAQVLKDAVMASSLEPFLDRRVLFCCGHFHSDYHLGIPFQLQKNHPKLRIAVIVTASTVEPLPMKERPKISDFIWVEE
ncbi:MAG: ChaN family lipoprotein [Deltaproteobacteria bacterium]|nr:ChaN family lipoprotein [Deltaproteobacteria bacterium]